MTDLRTPAAGVLAASPDAASRFKGLRLPRTGTAVAEWTSRSPSMTRRILTIVLLLALPALAHAAAEDTRLADKARAALDVERRIAREQDPAARETQRRELHRAESEARAAAREELRGHERSETRLDRSDRRDVRVLNGQELSRVRERGAREREDRGVSGEDREHRRDRDRDDDRDRDRERERDDDRSETGSHDDGSDGTGDDNHGGGGSGSGSGDGLR